MLTQSSATKQSRIYEIVIQKYKIFNYVVINALIKYFTSDFKIKHKHSEEIYKYLTQFTFCCKLPFNFKML